MTNLTRLELTSVFRSIDLIELAGATDIHNTKFDSPEHPITVNGTLDSSITPVNYVPFVSIINSTQLARFGLHNGTLVYFYFRGVPGSLADM